MTDVRIAGGPTAEEVAAVLVALGRPSGSHPSRDGAGRWAYERWRAGRLAALRRRP